MNEQRLYRIIQGPLTTEKSVRAADKFRQITLKVVKDATKAEVKYAIEKLFNVVVSSVRTSNVKGKVKQFKQRQGQRSSWKKAIVKLTEGHDINFAEFK